MLENEEIRFFGGARGGEGGKRVEDKKGRVAVLGKADSEPGNYMSVCKICTRYNRVHVHLLRFT